MRIAAAIGLSLGLLGGTAAANAGDCPGHPGAIGTSRVLKIDPREHPRIGTMQYPDTLPLADKEVVLTFDDGPMPPYTSRILEILAHECVKANYFIIGRMARGYPDLIRRILAEGHVIGTHSQNHPLAFDKMPARAVQAEVEQGIASTAAALGNRDAVAPFFRIPGLLRADNVEGYLRSRGLAIWSADISGDDWKHISASEVVKRSIARLDSKGKGVLLLHDIQPATALALPHLLRELKRRGYRIVQVAPASAPALVASAPLQTAPAVAQPQRESHTPPQPLLAAPKPAPTTRPEPADEVTATAAPPEPAASPAAASPARPDGAVPEPARAPEPTKAPEAAGTPPSDLAAAGAAPAQAPAREPEPPPPSRVMPVPIMEAARTAPPDAGSGTVPTKPPVQQTARPLTPGFKPSHSASLPTKVLELPIERQPADPWAMRAELALPGRVGR